jgi:hypothetical protein
VGYDLESVSAALDGAVGISTGGAGGASSNGSGGTSDASVSSAGGTGGAPSAGGSSANSGSGGQGTGGSSGSGGAATGGVQSVGGSAGNGGAATGGGGAVDGSVPTGCTAATFNGHDYLLCTTVLSQPAAVAECAAHGMRLAKIETSAENQWIPAALLGPGVFDTIDTWIWIGGSDIATEGSWVWPDGTLFYQSGAPVNAAFVSWSPSEPNNAGQNEDCAILHVTFKWTDNDCSLQHHFVCERY